MTKKEKTVKSGIVKKAVPACSVVGQQCRCRQAGIRSLQALGLIGAMVLIAFGVHVLTERRVMIVESRRLWTEANAFKMIITETNKYEALVNADARGTLAALQKEQAELDASQGKIGTAEYKKKQDALKEKFALFNRMYEYRQQQVLKASEQAFLSIKKEAGEALTRVAERERAGIVIDARNVLYADDKTNNMTDAYIEEINKAIPSVVYPDPATIQVNPGE